MNKDFRIHSVKYNLIMNIILKLSSFIFPFITFPYVSRVLGPIGNGKIAFASSCVYYFTMIATLGIPTYGVKVCAQVRDNKEKLSKTVKELLIIESIMMAISYLSFILCLIFVPRLMEEKELMIINSFTIILTVFGVEWFYQAIEQYDYITFRNLIFKILSIVLMILFVKKQSDYIIYGGIAVLGTVGSNILNIIKLRRYINFNINSKLNLKMHIKPILILFMMTASTMIYTSLDTVMLGFMIDDTAVGYYNAATKLKSIFVSVVTALGVVLLPRLSNCLALKQYDKFKTLITKSFNYVFLVSLPCIFFVIFEARECIIFLTGNGYEPAIIPMQLILVSVFFIGLTYVIGIQMLIPLGKENITLISSVCGAIVNLIFNSIFIPKYGASGAAFSTTLAEFIVFCVQVYYIREHITKFIDFKNLSKILISLALGLVILILIKHIAINLSLFIQLCIMGIAFFAAYGVSLICFKESIVRSVFHKFIKKIFYKN